MQIPGGRNAFTVFGDQQGQWGSCSRVYEAKGGELGSEIDEGPVDRWFLQERWRKPLEGFFARGSEVNP